ncbi:MAG: YceI family protein [Flavobacteriales bacterium]|jgi:polyisoprenoid-binding protein YceI|nr:YceI family protein [Flavobacteriales bacterium]
METSTTTKWAVDAAHSELQFKVKHLVISTVTGSFKSFSGEINGSDDNFEGASVEITVDINSIDTNQADRDNHLKSDDFFAAATYPTMHFSGHVTGDKLAGDLTVRGTTNKVIFDLDFNGIANDPWGNTKAGFELNGKINRKDFGLTWNAITEAGGMLVSEDIKIVGNIQLAKA